MGASQFVGRVGGLAVALGVGAAVFSGAGVASADRGDGAGASSASSADNASSSPRSARTGRGSEQAAPAAATRQAPAAAEVDNEIPSAVVDSVPVELPTVVVSDPTPVVIEQAPAVTVPEVTVAGPQAVSEPVATVVEPQVAIDPIVITDPVVVAPKDTEFTPAPATDEVTAFVTGVAQPSDGAGTDPSAPVDSPLVAAFLALARRDPFAAAATDSPAALVTASSGLSLAPVTTYFDGVLQGNLNVTSKSGCGTAGSDCKLVYSFVDSSDGGKVSALDKVPAELPGGGAGSYVFLPYATWIDPAAPTKFPTPTGTQDFTVRVSENTQFDQTITGIPLVGLIAAPIIKLMQDTPFVGDLLAPLIGAAVKQKVTVDVGQLVPEDKQVAYTIFVDSFDGTRISMNYFPASEGSLLDSLGNEQATIFNGPGLGAPGETNPYLLFQAAGSVPGLALMRGQGLPAPFDKGLGFNVITWDPRGEFASGGILQLDSPFFEGRDVSALIDWANANTPLLSENGSPDIAMMGGSYGGGIQMTTVDPRIKAIVPSIAWNSLNESLYPGAVFKTAWANALALALLGGGASSLDRVNSQITQALITGNLFGFVSETAQAVLASSGPTSLMTKLSAPTMYVQGIIDGLFPLQQALTNGQTQLEQNPYFDGNAGEVKMIWFCGGHGICTTQTLEQQETQATTVFLENILWANRYAKSYLGDIPLDPPVELQPGVSANNLGKAVSLIVQYGIATFQWWDQNGDSWSSSKMPYTEAFQNTPPITGTNATGGRINSFTSKSGPLTADDPAGAVCASIKEACGFPLNQVFATKAKDAVNVTVTVPKTEDPKKPSVVVGAPKVSFTYSGVGNAKAVYAQIVDDATGQVLGNVNTAIPVTLDGKEHTITDFPIANIAYTAPLAGPKVIGDNTLTLQIVANSALYQNTAVIWSVDVNKVSVSLPTTSTAGPNKFKLPA